MTIELQRLIRLIFHLAGAFLLKNPWRRREVRRRQEQALRTLDLTCRRAIIFIVPGFDRVDGGILSLSSLVEESARLSGLHEASVFACPLPGEPPLAEYTKFENQLVLLDYDSLIGGLTQCREILIHVPECYTGMIPKALGFQSLRDRGVDLKVNILLQNVDSIPTRQQVDRLQSFGTVSVTTAHIAYATDAVSERLGAPLFHLSVWNSPERYENIPYKQKENKILLSPDDHPMRRRVIKALRKALPQYEFHVVRNMRYRDYRSLCATSKFALTFGEGLDGYYIETIFSGGLSCAVFNDRFFTVKYRDLPLMFDDWSDVIQKLPMMIHQLDHEASYLRAWRAQFEVAASDYRNAEYIQNLVSFYKQGVQWRSSGAVDV